MRNPAEYQLKAENYAFAARVTDDDNRRFEMLRLAAKYRNKALIAQLGNHSGVLRRCPFTRDELRPY